MTTRLYERTPLQNGCDPGKGAPRIRQCGRPFNFRFHTLLSQIAFDPYSLGHPPSLLRGRLMSSVLIVEPDPQVRGFIAGILADFGHQVRQCRDTGDAAAWLAGARFDILATDLTLDLSRIKPSIPVLTLSGFRWDPVDTHRKWRTRLSEKPFRFADLHRLVASIDASAPTYALAA